MDWLTEMLGKEVEITFEGPRPLVAFTEAQLLEVCNLGIVFAHGKRTQFAPWHTIRNISEPRGASSADSFLTAGKVEVMA